RGCASLRRDAGAREDYGATGDDRRGDRGQHDSSRIGAAVEHPRREVDPSVISRTVDRVGDAEQHDYPKCLQHRNEPQVGPKLLPSPVGLDVWSTHLATAMRARYTDGCSWR